MCGDLKSPLWLALADQRLSASVIANGLQLSGTMVAAMLRAKGQPRVAPRERLDRRDRAFGGRDATKDGEDVVDEERLSWLVGIPDSRRHLAS